MNCRLLRSIDVNVSDPTTNPEDTSQDIAAAFNNTYFAALPYGEQKYVYRGRPPPKHRNEYMDSLSDILQQRNKRDSPSSNLQKSISSKSKYCSTESNAIAETIKQSIESLPPNLIKKWEDIRKNEGETNEYMNKILDYHNSQTEKPVLEVEQATIQSSINIPINSAFQSLRRSSKRMWDAAPDAEPHTDDRIKCICNAYKIIKAPKDIQIVKTFKQIAAKDNQLRRPKIKSMPPLSFGLVFLSSNLVGIKCTICECWQHGTCALFSTYGLLDKQTIQPSLEVLTKYIRNFRCTMCKVQLMDPMYSIIDLASVIVLAPGPLSVGKKFGYDVYKNYASVRAVPAKNVLHIMLGCKIGGIQECMGGTFFPSYPLKLNVQATKKNRIESVVDLGEPPPLKMRKDAVLELSISKYRDEDDEVELSVISTIKHLTYNESDKSNFSSSLIAFATAVKLTPEILYNVLIRTSWIDITTSKAICTSLSQTLYTDDDLSVVNDKVHDVPLTCPSTLTRLVTPARGISCSHLQCFELSYFLQSQIQMAGATNKWKCPVCSVSCYPHEIMIDGYTKDILEKTTPDVTKIYMAPSEGDMVWHVTERASDGGEYSSSEESPQDKNENDIKKENRNIEEQGYITNITRKDTNKTSNQYLDIELISID